MGNDVVIVIAKQHKKVFFPRMQGNKHPLNAACRIGITLPILAKLWLPATLPSWERTLKLSRSSGESIFTHLLSYGEAIVGVKVPAVQLCLDSPPHPHSVGVLLLHSCKGIMEVM